MRQRELNFMVYNQCYIYAYMSLPEGKVRESTGLTVQKKLFDDWKAGEPGAVIPEKIIKKMSRIKYVVEQYIQKCEIGDLEISKDAVEKIIRESVRRKPQQAASGSPATTFEAFDRYVKELKAGNILNKGKTYSKSSIKTNKSILSQIEGIEKLKNKLVNKLSVGDIELFNKHLIEQKLTQNTVSAYVNQFVFFLERTHGFGWHHNEVFKSVEFVPSEDVDYHIALSEKEISEMYKVACTGDDEEIRDLFVFGCYTGLRDSDLKQSLDIRGMKNNILEVGTIKTGETVHIPVNSIARKIWDKYKGKFRYFYHNKFKDAIQDIAKRAAIAEETLISRTEGGKKITRYKKRWQLVQSHTMRRSFATNSYKAGVPHQTIMKITGHQDYDSFKKYIRLSNLEHAELAQKNEFFK